MPSHQSLYLGRANKRHTDNIQSPKIVWGYDNHSHVNSPLNSNGEHFEKSHPTAAGIVFCWIEESRETGHNKRRAMVHRLMTTNKCVILKTPVDLMRIPGPSLTWDMPVDIVEKRLCEAIAANRKLENEIRELAADGSLEME